MIKSIRGRIICALAGIIIFAAGSGFCSDETGGGLPGEFLRYGAGARSMAMGGVYTSIADDATAVYWNPAGLSQMVRPGFQFMHSNLYLDSQLLYGALAYPHYGVAGEGSKLTYGFGMLGFKMEGFEPYSAEDQYLGGTFDESQMAVTTSLAYDRISHLGRISAGVNIIAFNHEIYDYGDWGAGVDFGLMTQFINPPDWSLIGLLPIKYLMPWRFGAVYHDATGEELLRGDEDYPNSLRLGISNSDIRVPKIPGKFIASYEFGRLLSGYNDKSHRLGCEYQIPLYEDFLFCMRGGLDLTADEDEGMGSWGFGLRGGGLSLLGWNGSVGFDFAQKTHGQLSSANFISLSLMFGPPSPEDPEMYSGRTELEEGNENNLVRSLLTYNRNPALAHTDSARVEAEKENYNGVARTLRDRFAVGSRNHARYDDFIMGITNWLLRITDAVHDYRELVFENKTPGGRGDDLEEAIEQWKDQFNSFLEGVADRLDKLRKPDNIEALRYYLTDLLLVGRDDDVRREIETGGLAASNSGFSEWDRLYFKALSDRNETDALRQVIDNHGGPFSEERYKYVNIYLKFLLAVREEDRSLLRDIVASTEAKSFGLDYYPVTPFMPDGIIADDAMLIKSCLEIKNNDTIDPEEAMQLLTDSIESYRGGSAFNTLAAYKPASVEESGTAARAIIEFYNKNSAANGIFWPR